MENKYNSLVKHSKAIIELLIIENNSTKESIKKLYKNYCYCFITKNGKKRCSYKHLRRNLKNLFRKGAICKKFKLRGKKRNYE